MRLRIRDVKLAVQRVGMTARYRDGEWRINYPPPFGTEDTAYYTGDGDDAIGTARDMALRSPELCRLLPESTSTMN